MTIKIIVATHVPYWIPPEAMYVPVHVGRAGKASLGYSGDDTGDNISQKNAHFCELTGLYWAWKNLSADYLGLTHYRRHFSIPGARSKSPHARVLAQKQLEPLLEKYDVLLPKPRHYWIETNWGQYAHAHHEVDLAATRAILCEREPRFVPVFDRVMMRRSGHRFNMFIMKREVLDRYCQWLFDILFELEKRLDISRYAANDARVFGFVAERLIDVWLETNGVVYHELPYVVLEKQRWLVKGWRFVKRKFARHGRSARLRRRPGQLLAIMRRRGVRPKHVLVEGTGKLARQYAASIANGQALGYQIDGYIGAAAARNQDLHPRISDLDALDELLRKPGIDEVVALLEPEGSDFMLPVVRLCEKNGARVRVIPADKDIGPDHPTAVETTGDSKPVSLRSNPLEKAHCASFKRAFDLVMGGILLVAVSPLMLLVAIGVKMTSPGPILFKQERVGLNNRVFSMLKFRSMRVNSMESCGWTIKNDPRCTSFGNFLRKYGMDELPQLINILRGDMSLIGPRPEIPFYVERFRKSIPQYMDRHRVRPGLTGWAQVNGFRGDTSIKERIRHDIWYIENWRVSLDMKILWMTIFCAWVNWGKGTTRRKGT